METQNEIIQELGYIVIGAYYDYQEIRIGLTNRVRCLIRQKIEGIDVSKPEDKKEEDEKKYDKKYKDENLHELVIQNKNKFSETEYEYITSLIEGLKNTEKLENGYKKQMQIYVTSEPIYTTFLKDIKGISTILAGNLIKEYKYCENSPHASSLWKMSGLHVVDGHAPKPEKGVKLEFNPKLRTLCWKIGDSFIKQRTPVYREIYDNEKARQLSLMENLKCETCGSRPDEHTFDKTKKTYLCPKPNTGIYKYSKSPTPPMRLGHADSRARRKMVKIFVSHYWLKARTIKGLPISLPYAIEKLGHTHIIKP